MDGQRRPTGHRGAPALSVLSESSTAESAPETVLHGAPGEPTGSERRPRGEPPGELPANRRRAKSEGKDAGLRTRGRAALPGRRVRRKVPRQYRGQRGARGAIGPGSPAVTRQAREVASC
jgi:hypothetical protein